MKGNLILVVDDDASLRRVMKMQLEEAGYQVALAASGEEALGVLDQRQPDLVITDLRMPGTGGMDLLRHIREAHPETTSPSRSTIRRWRWWCTVRWSGSG